MERLFNYLLPNRVQVKNDSTIVLQRIRLPRVDRTVLSDFDPLVSSYLNLTHEGFSIVTRR